MSIGIVFQIEKGGADYASVVEIYIIAVYSYYMGSVWSVQIACSRLGSDSRDFVRNNACRCGSAVLLSGRAARRRFSGDRLSYQPLRFAEAGGVADGKDWRYQLCLAGFSRKLNQLCAGRFGVPLIFLEVQNEISFTCLSSLCKLC